MKKSRMFKDNRAGARSSDVGWEDKVNINEGRLGGWKDDDGGCLPPQIH